MWAAQKVASSTTSGNGNDGSNIEVNSPKTGHESEHTFLRFSKLRERPHPTIDQVIRVNHAGEFGADRIYAGQAAILEGSEVGRVIKVGDYLEFS